jgi:hypothetical protein
VFNGGEGRVSIDAQVQYLTVNLSGARASVAVFGIGVIAAP